MLPQNDFEMNGGKITSAKFNKRDKERNIWATSRTNCFQKKGGSPKWEVPKQGHVRLVRNHEINGKTLCFQSKCSFKGLSYGNE